MPRVAKVGLARAIKLQTPFCKMQRQTTEIENVELARNATSRGRLGRRLLGRGWRRFANGDRRGRDGAAHSRHLKPGSARFLAEGAERLAFRFWFWRWCARASGGVTPAWSRSPPYRPAGCRARNRPALAPIENGSR